MQESDPPGPGLGTACYSISSRCRWYGVTSQKKFVTFEPMLLKSIFNAEITCTISHRSSPLFDLCWVTRVILTQLLSSTQTETKHPTNTGTVHNSQSVYCSCLKFCDHQINGRVDLFSNRAQSQIFKNKSYRRLGLKSIAIIWLWKRPANCGRLLSLLYIRGRMLLSFDSAEWEPAAGIDVCW